MLNTFQSAGRGATPPPAGARPVRVPVVSVGRDKSLLRARQTALETAGGLICSLTPEQAESLVHDASPRLWIFCGSVEAQTLVYLGCCIRRHSPGSRLVLIEHNQQAGIESSLFHRVLRDKAATGSLCLLVRDLEARA